MKIWLVTTGSSDIQLTTDESWNDWYRVVKRDCYDLPVEKIKPKQVIEDNGEPYRVAPRILGQIYSAQPEQVWEYLRFPLLDAFSAQLEDKGIDKVIVLLTDQSFVFGESDRDKVQCPYWQDTCALLLMLERYFAKHFPESELKVLTLQPTEIDKGLDDWNEALTLVRTTLGKIQFEADVAYVSHQAGTPAISSAVQFVTLSQYRSNVQFLVSNEYRTERTQLIGSSTYLRGIQFQEAEALLRNYDYAGVKELLGPYLNSEAKQLLNAAIQWNCSKFDEFACLLGTISGQRTETWWWTAYEAAYLAVIRHCQKDIVDAFFHSFRSIEGAFSEWGKNEFKAHIEIRNERPYLQTTILSDPKGYFSTAKFKQDGKPKDDLAKLKRNLEKLQSEGKDIILYGENLYPLFRLCRKEYRLECSELSQFWDSNNGISEKRNKIFHQLKGLSEIELIETWNVTSIDNWQLKILSYLNFMTGQLHFTSLSEASLMKQVHSQLKSIIASLAQTQD